MDNEQQAELRIAAVRALGKHIYCDREDPIYPFIALQKLLGYKDYPDFVKNTEKHAAILSALAGPHGLTIYKILKLRQEKPNDGKG